MRKEIWTCDRCEIEAEGLFEVTVIRADKSQKVIELCEECRKEMMNLIAEFLTEIV